MRFFKWFRKPEPVVAPVVTKPETPPVSEEDKSQLYDVVVHDNYYDSLHKNNIGLIMAGPPFFMAPVIPSGAIGSYLMGQFGTLVVDTKCAYCASKNSFRDGKCQRCGAPEK